MKDNLHTQIGYVYDLKLNSEGNFADVIVRRKGETDSPLVMGQFVILAAKENDEVNFNRVFIGTVMSEIPDMENNFELKNSLRHSLKSDKKLDKHYRDQNLYVAYRCRMIGVCYDENESITYYSNIRSYPTPTSLSLYMPSNDFMNRLFESAIKKSDNDEQDIIFKIGKLQYGTDPLYTKNYSLDKEVKVYFNATNLLRKRTAILGKSGYGKSNTVKTVIGMMSTKHPTCGQLILDTNGEYALDNSQNDGLMDIFHEAGMREKCVLYTHREISEKVIQKFGQKSIKKLKFDVFSKIKPALDIVIHNLDGRTEPLYLNPWSAALDGVDDEYKYFKTESIKNPNLVWAVWYAALIRAGLSPANEVHKQGTLKIGKDFLESQIDVFIENDIISKNDLEEGKNGKIEVDLKDPSILKNIAEALNCTVVGNSLETNNIIMMAKYADWYYENNVKEGKKDSSMKSFCEIIENPRRFTALKAYNVTKEDGKSYNISLSLGESVFKDLAENKIVILDLASVSIQVAKTLAQQVLGHLLSSAIRMFGDYKNKDQFKNFDALVYIEEAQNYLKPEEVKNGSIYERIAKEGRKFHIGLVYVTQQPSAIDPSITSQTENIIAMHMSNSRDCFILGEIKDKFDQLTCKFLKDEAQKGLAYIYAEPHQPFVLPCLIDQFNKDLILNNRKKK